jgi:Protein of unknown function (DUF2442)
MERLVRIRSVGPIVGFADRLEFTDGTAEEINLGNTSRTRYFEPLQTDPVRFREVRVESRAGTISWPNGADIDPDVSYGDLEPVWAHDDTNRAITGSVTSALTLVQPCQIYRSWSSISSAVT